MPRSSSRRASARPGVHWPAALGLGVGAWALGFVRAERRSAAWVLAIAVLARIPFALGDATSNDLHRYLWEGRVVLAGESPYALAPIDPALAPLRDEGFADILFPELPTVYPPLAQGLFAAAAALEADPPALRNGFLALDLVVVVLLVGWLRAAGKPVGWASFYGWSPVAIVSAGLGHLDPAMLAGLTGMGWAWQRGRPALAALGLAVGILAKGVAVLLLPWLALRQPRVAFGITVPVVLLGWLPFASQGPVLGSLGRFATEFSFNGPLHAALPEGALGTAIAALALAAWTIGIALTQPHFAVAWAASMLGLLLLSPTVHYWYLSWFLVPLAWIGLRSLTAPAFAWCASVAFLAPVYAGFAAGRDHAESLWVALEFGVPLLVAVAAFAPWRRRVREAPDREVAPAPSKEPTRFGVVIPAHREAENLRVLLPRWLETEVAEVVVADWPGDPETRALAADDPRVRWIRVDEAGYGRAVAAGLDALVDCDVAIVCDADQLGGPARHGALLAPFADPGVALVCGARGDDSPLAPLQRLGNALVCALIALGWSARFRDLGPFRAIRLAAWPDFGIEDRGYGWNVEMNVRALEAGHRVVEVPIVSGARVHGRDRITGTWRGTFGAAWGMCSRLYRLREAHAQRSPA